jgi:hypothetical protein
MSRQPSGQCGAGLAEAVDEVGLEFTEPVKQELSIETSQKGDVDGRVTDDLDGGRNNGIDFGQRRANKQNGDGLIGKSYEEVFEIKRIFCDGSSRGDNGDARRQGPLRLEIGRNLVVGHNIPIGGEDYCIRGAGYLPLMIDYSRTNGF